MVHRIRACVLAASAAFVPVVGMAAEAPISIGAVKVETKTSTVGRTKGNDYLRISFTATVNDRVAPRMYVRVKGKAKVGDAVKVDDFSATGRLEDIQAGESKDLTALLFMQNGLGGSADQCELTFTLAKLMDKTGRTLGEFCWTGGARAKPGACEN
jgi:hypothetical protein